MIRTTKLIQPRLSLSEAAEYVFISTDKRIIVSIHDNNKFICRETQEEINGVITELTTNSETFGFPYKFLDKDISREGE